MDRFQLTKISISALFLLSLLLSPSNKSFAQHSSFASSVPEWMLYPGEGVKSLGIARRGALSDSMTYQQAFDRALQSLNANRRIWVLAEHYDRAMNEIESFYEFSLEELLDSTSVKVSREFETDEWLFLEVEPTDSTNANSRKKVVEGENDQWIEVVGIAPMIFSNPHLAFEKAKQQAFKEIARQTDLKVMGTTSDINGYSNDLYFMKSRVRIEYAEIVARWVEDDRCHVQLRVLQANVQAF